MADLILGRADRGRWAVILAAALAMLMPLPARCTACVASAGECPHCVAANPVKETPPAPKACCQHRATHTTSPDTNVATPTVKLSTQACGCTLRTAPRTVPTVEKLVSSADLVALHATVAYEPIPTINSAAARVTTLADLPPSVPHRVLHCSWII